MHYLKSLAAFRLKQTYPQRSRHDRRVPPVGTQRLRGEATAKKYQLIPYPYLWHGVNMPFL